MKKIITTLIVGLMLAFSVIGVSAQNEMRQNHRSHRMMKRHHKMMKMRHKMMKMRHHRRSHHKM